MSFSSRPPERPHLTCEIAERVLTLTLERPAMLNAFSYPMLAAILEVFQWAEASPDVGAIVVTGAGRAFSSGTDLSASADGFDTGAGAPRGNGSEADPDFGGIISQQIFRSSKPVLAAINGPAVGFGATFGLPMDLRFASPDAYFAFIFARRGLLPEACSTWFLPKVVGIAKALEWTMTARKVGADEALRAGLINEIVPADSLLSHTQDVAREIIREASASSLLVTRRSLWGMVGQEGPEAAHLLESRCMAALRDLPDFQRAITAFRQKETASFDPVPPDSLKANVDAWLGNDG